MKVIIAGSRTITSYATVAECIRRSGFTITEVVCGMALGVDSIGQFWARMNNVPVVKMPADWATHGKSAGYRRNEAMAAVADACIVVWDGASKGSQHMASIAKAKGLPLKVYRVKA